MLSNSPRRRFLTTSGAGLLILKSQTVFGSQANSALEIGLTGCGGRGNWVGGLFKEFTGARLVALHDVYQDRLEFTRDNLKSPDARLYRGAKGFEEMLASKLDAVVMESPPYARPQQSAAAVAAGKHCYMAKPVAVDVWGCNLFAATGEKAKGKLSYYTDFQYRARDGFRECVDRVHRGAIGKPVLGHVYYHTGRLNPRNVPGDTPESARLRNWVFDKALSGDIIVEQNIHALDAGAWMLNAAPLKAYGTGGRKIRLDGDCWDHFAVTYWYPDDVIVDFSSTQCVKGYNDIVSRIYGSEGTAEMRYYGSATITGPNAWNAPEKLDAGRQGTIDNIRAFADSIRTGQYLNNSADTVRSNLTAILGRTAAYRNAVVTWDEMVRSNERLDLRLPSF